MATNKEQCIREELLAISKKHKGILKPCDVITYAERHKNSALYSQFTWDDSKAAHAHRLFQARQIILKVNVTINIQDKPITIRPFVSIHSDRYNGAGGGYRNIIELKEEHILLAELQQQALDELRRIKDKYSMLTKLASALDHLIESDIFGYQVKKIA
jgi:hypothetical protein